MLKDLEEKLQAHILLIYNNPEEDDSIIDYYILKPLYEQLKELNKYNKLILLIETKGGNLAVGSKILEIIKEKFKIIEGIVLGRCSSTGTFILLGTNKIYVGPYSMITPSEPQITIDNKSYSTSVVRNYLKEKNSLDPIIYGNYISIINYYKKLCKESYKNSEKIINYMLKEVDSHQYPLNNEDFKKMDIEVDKLPEDLEKILLDKHNKILNYLKDKTNLENRFTLIESSNKILVRKKIYDNNKKLKKFDYFKIEESEYEKY